VRRTECLAPVLTWNSEGDLGAHCGCCGYEEFIRFPVTWLFIQYHSIPVSHCIYCWGDPKANMLGARSFGRLRMPHPSTL